MAKTYRWVDDNGVTVYSQTPPPTGNATIIKPPPSPATPPDEIMQNLKRRQTAIDEAKKKKNKSGKKETAEARNAEIKQQNCDTSRKNLEEITRHPRVRMKMDDGSYKQLSDEERQAEIDKYNKDIEKFCN